MQAIYEELLPKKLRVFFGTNGLTIAEANHKADLIKHMAEATSALFNSTAAYHAVMDFDGREVQLDHYKPIDLEVEALKEGDMYMMSSWLRESVAAKKKMLELVSQFTTQTLWNDDETFPVFNVPIPPSPLLPRLKLLTEDDVIGEWNIAQRAKYLSLESKAAHLGKKIHPKGVINNIKKDILQEKAVTFTEKSDGRGLKTYVVTHHPLYSKADATKAFFKLQEQHRSYESQLNYLKATIQNTLTTENSRLQKEYSEDLQSINSKHQADTAAYRDLQRQHSDALSVVHSQMEQRRLELTRFVSGLKVQIPDDLTYIIDLINQEK